MNMKEVIILDTAKVVNFLDQVIKHLFNEFNFDKCTFIVIQKFLTILRQKLTKCLIGWRGLASS